MFPTKAKNMLSNGKRRCLYVCSLWLRRSLLACSGAAAPAAAVVAVLAAGVVVLVVLLGHWSGGGGGGGWGRGGGAVGRVAAHQLAGQRVHCDGKKKVCFSTM